MKNSDLKTMGLTELSSQEMRETNGGLIMLLIRAFAQPAIVVTTAIIDHFTESRKTDDNNQE